MKSDDPLEQFAKDLEESLRRKLTPKMDEIQSKGWMIFMPVREEIFKDLFTTVAVTMVNGEAVSVAAFGMTEWTALESLFERIDQRDSDKG